MRLEYFFIPPPHLHSLCGFAALSLSFSFQALCLSQVKRRCGSAPEKALYEGMTWECLLDRLLTQRPLVFMDACDEYQLLGQHRDSSGVGGFERIGTEEERGPLRLSQLLSYDEMYICGG